LEHLKKLLKISLKVSPLLFAFYGFSSILVHCRLRHSTINAVNLMWQRCQSRYSAVVDVTVLLAWCDSAANHATVPSWMWWCCQPDTTALSIMQQCHSWCDGAVGLMQQRCQSCDSVVTDVMVLSMWCDSGVHHALMPFVDVTVLSMWCDSAVHHATLPLLMRRCCQPDATGLSIIWQCCQLDMTMLWIMQQCRCSCDSVVNQMHTDSAVDHVVTWLTALSHDQQHSHMLNSYVVQLTTNIFKGQCRPNRQWWCCNCVSWLPFIVRA
jgi:hypothetical protein